jgi:DNA invertase Pin-like site-specific DNA recombinase
MRVKYNRTSTMNQDGERFKVDEDQYSKTIMDKGVSGVVPFREREGGREIVDLVERGELKELVVEELSRLGRNTGDCITTLEWLEENEINVVVRNIGLQSRPNGVKNPIWKMITSVMSSIYEMELENIKERTHYGRMMYVRNGGKLGRPKGSEKPNEFLSKPKSKQIMKYLELGMSVRETSKLVGCSSKTVMKVKRLSNLHQTP